MSTALKSEGSRPNPKPRHHVHVHRMRRRGETINRYQLDSRMDALFRGVKTTEELRERFRAFVANEQVWRDIEAIVSTDRQQEKNLAAFEKTCVKIGGPRK